MRTGRCCRRRSCWDGGGLPLSLRWPRRGWPGRGLLPDRGRAAFCSGANAAITGDMLTTAGITVETDLALVRGLG
ncbi:MAG: hypothetical protein ACLVL7_01705 [Anaerotruncus massiliensis (ex Togo et al. 2019)]